MSGRHPTLNLSSERYRAALDAARELGIVEGDAVRIAMRAEREYWAGVRNDTASFAGKVSIGTYPDGRKALSIYTYTGRVIDPLATGIAGASTLD